MELRLAVSAPHVTPVVLLLSDTNIIWYKVLFLTVAKSLLLYSLFDECIGKYDAYKVVTLGDIYMAVSGAPTPNDKKHAAEIASMALLVNDRVKRYTIPHLPVMRLALRTGIHSGLWMLIINTIQKPPPFPLPYTIIHDWHRL